MKWGLTPEIEESNRGSSILNGDTIRLSNNHVTDNPNWMELCGGGTVPSHRFNAQISTNMSRYASEESKFQIYGISFTAGGTIRSGTDGEQINDGDLFMLKPIYQTDNQGTRTELDASHNFSSEDKVHHVGAQLVFDNNYYHRQYGTTRQWALYPYI